MTTFTIDNDNNITAFGSAEEAAAATTTPFDSFASQKELAELAAAWPAGAPGGHLEQPAGRKAGEGVQERQGRRQPHLGAHPGPRASPPSPRRNPRSRRPTRRPRVAHRRPRARPPRPRRPRRPPPPRTRPRPKRPPRRRKAPGRAKAARRPRWSRCSSARTARRWPRSWTRWDGKNTPSAGSWPAR